MLKTTHCVITFIKIQTEKLNMGLEVRIVVIVESWKGSGYMNFRE